MLPRKNRLNHAVFTARPSRRARFKYGTIAFFDGSGAAAVVVSKRVAKRAPDRNRIKRRMYHAIRSVGAYSKKQFVVYPSVEAGRAEFRDIVSSLEQALVTR